MLCSSNCRCGCIAFYTCSIIIKLGFRMQLYDTLDLVFAMWGQRVTVVMSAMFLLMAYNI